MFDSGVELDETAQDGLPLAVAESGQFFEDFGHAHRPSLQHAQLESNGISVPASRRNALTPT